MFVARGGGSRATHACMHANANATHAHAHARTEKLQNRFPPNSVRNQKYNAFTFLPIVFYEQFKFFFNLYFLLVALSQFVPALKTFADMLEDPAVRFEYLLREGDAVLFDNRRVLHARTAFREKEAESSAEETDRWLKGCYLEADAIQDRRRVLDAQLEEEPAEA